MGIPSRVDSTARYNAHTLRVNGRSGDCIFGRARLVIRRFAIPLSTAEGLYPGRGEGTPIIERVVEYVLRSHVIVYWWYTTPAVRSASDERSQ